MKKTIYILSIAIGITVLVVGIVMLYGWFNRPLPIPLNDPRTQPIKDVLVKSHQIETILACAPESDVDMLEEVYKDTADYKQTPDNRVMIAKYLGAEAVKGTGYLTLKKAHHLWERSDDLYPRASPDPTLVYLATVAPTPKPVRLCRDPFAEPELSYQSIAIREGKAIVKYEFGPYQKEAILRMIDGSWFIVNSRTLAVSI